MNAIINNNGQSTTMAGPRPRRSVSFRQTCDVLLVPSHAEMTDEEYRATWYNEDEYDSITRDTIRTLREIRKYNSNKHNTKKNEPHHAGAFVGLRLCKDDDDDEDDGELCLRGLEALICSKSFKERKMAKDFVTSAVLGEQDRQRERGIYYEPEGMREASARTSVAPVSRAQSLAAADAAFVRRELLVAVVTYSWRERANNRRGIHLLTDRLPHPLAPNEAQGQAPRQGQGLKSSIEATFETLRRAEELSRRATVTTLVGGGPQQLSSYFRQAIVPAHGAQQRRIGDVPPPLMKES